MMLTVCSKQVNFTSHGTYSVSVLPGFACVIMNAIVYTEG